MKKIKVLWAVLAVVLVLSCFLSACNGGMSSGIQATKPNDDAQFQEKDPEVIGGNDIHEGEKEKDKEQEQGQGDDISEEGQQGGSKIPKNATLLLKQAGKVAAVIDALPNATSMMEFADEVKEENVAAGGEDYVDFSDPDQNENYRTFLMSSRGRHTGNVAIVDWGDSFVRQSKEIKNYAVNNVVQLNTWVQNTEYGSDLRYLLDFDPITGVVTIEYQSDTPYDYEYALIRCTYNEEGKAVISATYTSYSKNQDFIGVSDLFYQEDSLWRLSYNFANEDETGNENEYVCECDLSKESKTFILFSNQNEIVLKRSDPFFEITVSRRYEPGALDPETGDPTYEITTNWGERLYNEDGDYVGSIQLTDVDTNHWQPFAVTLDLYETTGWESFYYEDGLFHLVVPNGISLDIADMYDEYYPYEGETENYTFTFYLLYSKGYTGPVALCFDLEMKEDAQLTKGQAFLEVLQTCGIRPKSDAVTAQFAHMDQYAEILAGFDAFGQDGNYEFNKAYFYEIQPKYMSTPLTVAQLDAIKALPFVDVTEQVADESYYTILQPVVSTTVNVNPEQEVLDLSALSIRLGGLLEEGESFNATLFATDDFTATELVRLSAVAQNGVLSFANFGEITLENLLRALPPENGSYRLKLLLGKTVNGKELPVSNAFDLTVNVPFAYSYVNKEFTMNFAASESSVLIEIVIAEHPEEGDFHEPTEEELRERLEKEQALQNGEDVLTNENGTDEAAEQ